MADDRVTSRTGGLGVGSVLIGLGVLALVAIVAFVLMSAQRNKAFRTDAVTSAASSLAAEPARPR